MVFSLGGLQMRSLILGLCVVSNSVFANFNAGEMMSSMMPLATTMLQNQQQAKQAEAQTDQARAQLVGQENAMVQQQAQLQQAETNNLMSQENKGYPILDPFARQSYWALRDTQFKQSMAIAAQRSQLETKASKDAIDKEFQATQQMMTAVGGLMKTAGAQVQKIGEASASKAASARLTGEARALSENKDVHCDQATKKCYQYSVKPESGCVAPAQQDGNSCRVPVPDNLNQAVYDARQGNSTTVAAPSVCSQVAGSPNYTCPGVSGEVSASQAREAFNTEYQRKRAELTARISQLEAGIRELPADNPQRGALRQTLNELESQKAELEIPGTNPFTTATSIPTQQAIRNQIFDAQTATGAVASGTNG